MDWLLIVPLILLENIFCMSLTPEESASEAWTLGIASALMIAVGDPGELVSEGPGLGLRFACFVFSFAIFVYIVCKVLVGLKGVIAKETNPQIASMLIQVCLAAVVAWCIYPSVDRCPFFGISGIPRQFLDRSV